MTKLVGIDIGHSAIKIAIVAPTKRGPYIEDFRYLRRSLDPNTDQELEIIEILKQFKESMKGQPYQVALALEQSKVAYRYKIFPFVERNKIMRTLPFELEDDLPYPIENAYCDAHIIKIQGNQSHVLAAATPQSNVHKLMESLRGLDLKIVKLTTPAIALSNVLHPLGRMPPKLPAALEDQQNSPNLYEKFKFKMILDIGFKSTTVNLYEGDLLLNSSVILWGTENLAKAISQRYEIPLIDAEKILFEKGFVLVNKETANYDQIVFSDTLTQALREFAQHLSLLIINFESLHQGLVSEILVTGGGSRLIHVAPLLTQFLEIPVNVLNFFQLWPGSGTINQKEVPFFAVALGLALENAKKPIEPTLQFLQGPYASTDEFWKKLIQKGKMPAVWATTAFVTLWLWSMFREELSTRMVDLINGYVQSAGETMAGLPKKQAKAPQIKSYIKSSRAIIKDRELYLQLLQKPDPFSILNKISEAAPNRKDSPGTVAQVRISGDSVEVEINLGSQGKKELWLNALKKIGRGTHLNELPSTNPNQLIVRFDFKGN